VQFQTQLIRIKLLFLSIWIELIRCDAISRRYAAIFTKSAKVNR